MCKDLKRRTLYRLIILLSFLVGTLRVAAQTPITSLESITNAAGHYVITADISGGAPGVATFSGTLEAAVDPATQMPYRISDLTEPLFTTLTGTVRNLVFVNVAISGHSGNTGAVAATANGAARIYNVGILGGSLSGTGHTGGLVGLLDGTARVVNCYSYADITGGTDVGGLVGHNNVASTTTNNAGTANNNLKTMVMNCMFYGNITGGTTVSPVYGGEIIRSNYTANNNSGINNYNYYRFNSTLAGGTIVYNCALAAEDRFLNRFEFYRQILNSNRELACWFATGSTADARSVMYKWVLETADLTNANPMPYPVLKPQGQYPSIVNPDAAHASIGGDRNTGTKLGTLTVSISMGSGGAQYAAPAGAAITTSSLTLNVTDKDYSHYNFNYRKVQLPYYNDVGTGNYTGGRVVTGWKITAVTGGTPGTFNEEDSDEGYNFADRQCTAKDLYSVSGRVFNQGAYYDVPDGVTAISIEPYWAKATYCSDGYYDKTYNSIYGNATDFAAPGVRYTNNTDYSINGSSQRVYTNLGTAIDNLGRNSSHTVYDYAVVLVGNYHGYYGNSAIKNDTYPFTVMSADLDRDNEPDYCLIYQHQQRQSVSPVRFDFLCWPGVGMAQKANGSARMPGIGIFRPRGWFEVTNTCLAQFYEFEYDNDNNKASAPLILQGGLYEQIVSTNQNADATHTRYIHLGGNAWFKMFNNGVHSDKDKKTTHTPISVTGGDYDRFYLTGMFRPNAAVTADNAECYISGGRFGEVAGAGQEQINGNVTWKIDRADIDNFYGGGINAAKPITGNVSVTIANSYVNQYCGGPKFGDMAAGKTVTTVASACTFGTYFGAGYGGTSYNRIIKQNLTNNANYNFSSWASSGNDRSGYQRGYYANNGIATNFEYELFAYAGFADNNNVGRFYVNYASLSLAVTHDVSSTLSGCTVTGNFYGGGSLGKVEGNITSALTDCTVGGNVYGAGFSATVPSVDVMPQSAYIVEPYYNGAIGAYTIGVPPSATSYTWSAKGSNSSPFTEDGDGNWIHTNADLTTLGTVTGNVDLTLGGATAVAGSVFGGGEESAVTGDSPVSVTVTLQGQTHVTGSVYGGGDQGRVDGNTSVILKD